MRLLAPVAFILLVLATVGAFALAQRLKRQPLVLDKVVIGPLNPAGLPSFSPNGDGLVDHAFVRFRITNDDSATIQVLDKRGRVVRTLVRDRPLPAFRNLAFRWDGRTGTGRLAPTGPYRIQVRLIGQDRTLDLNPRVRLHDLSLVPASQLPKPVAPAGVVTATKPQPGPG